MPKKSSWKAKYEREWRSFLHRLVEVQERGYNIPEHLENKTKAKGGYKQAYEYLHRYSIPQIQRESTYTVPKKSGIGVEEIPGGRAMTMQRQFQAKYGGTVEEFYDIRHQLNVKALTKQRKELAKLRKENEKRKREFEEIWKRTQEEIRAMDLSRDAEIPETPTQTPQAPPPVEPAEGLVPSVEMSEDVMPQEDVRKSIIEEVEYYIETIQNKSLKYKLKKLYADNIVHNYWDALNNMKDSSSEVISLLQEAASLPYYTKGVSQDFLDDLKEKEKSIAGKFERLLTGTYTDASRMDNAERS